MENQILSNNTTLAGLRRLLRAAKEIVGPKEAVQITLTLWHYNNTPGSGRIVEKIGVYRSGEGPTREFSSLKDAYAYLETMKNKILEERRD